MMDQTRQHALKVMAMLRDGAAAQSEIVASWHRCVKLHDLSPDQDSRTEILSQLELREAWDRLEPYIRIAEADLLSLARLVEKAGFYLSFADANGTALLHRGALPQTGDIKRKIRDGMMWREDLQGTNAIGTGLFLSHPTAIHMGEHFLASNSCLTCLVAPLYDPVGQVLGAVNIATANMSFDRTLSPPLLGTLVATAQRIESRLFRSAFPDALIFSPETVGGHGSIPLIAADRELNVIGATHAVRCSYGITSQALAAGISIGRFFPSVAVDQITLAQAEQVTLERALNAAGYCVSLAASHLGISRATMHRKMRAHAISRRQNGKRCNAEKRPPAREPLERVAPVQIAETSCGAAEGIDEEADKRAG